MVGLSTAGLCGVLATWRVVWCSSSYYYLVTAHLTASCSPLSSMRARSAVSTPSDPCGAGAGAADDEGLAAAEWAEKEVGPEPEVGTKPEPDVGTE